MNTTWHLAFAANLKTYLPAGARVLQIACGDASQSIRPVMEQTVEEFVEVDGRQHNVQSAAERALLVARYGSHYFDAVVVTLAGRWADWQSVLTGATALLKRGGILAVVMDAPMDEPEAGRCTPSALRQIFTPLGSVLIQQHDAMMGVPHQYGIAIRMQSEQRCINDWMTAWAALQTRGGDLPEDSFDELAPAVAAMQFQRLVAERDGLVRQLKVATAERDQLEAELGTVLAERNWAQVREKILLDSTSWRYTRPLRVAGRLLRGHLNDEDRAKLQAVAGRMAGRLPAPVRSAGRLMERARRRMLHLTRRFEPSGPAAPNPDCKPADKLAAVPDYVIFGLINWHFRFQRPQQLAQAIKSSGRRVFYINNKLLDRDEPGFAVTALDETGRLFCVSLFLSGAPPIYSTVPNAAQLDQLRLGMAQVLSWAGISEQVAMVQHPFWGALAMGLPDARVVYDCMDHHEGFGSVPPALLTAERDLLRGCDLTVTTSCYLDELVGAQALNKTIIRNAVEYVHFATAPADLYRDPKGRRIIGYYGAIADWFDVKLVGAVAAAFPDCAVVLVGEDTVNAQQQLAAYDNVVLLGEIPYARLPAVAHAFDVCLLPFRVVPLTLATNPVKVYEYLAMGKPVVAVDLPEMHQFGGLCRVAVDQRGFVEAVSQALKDDTGEASAARRAFARGQDWASRAVALTDAAESTDRDPLVSVIVVTYNNLALTRQCLASIDQYSHYANREVIVVDND